MVVRAAGMALAAVLTALVLSGCGGTDDIAEGGAGAAHVAPTETTTTSGGAAPPESATPVVRISADEAVVVLAEEDVRVVDVRTPQEFAEGHLPGAVNVDLAADDFDALVSALPREDAYLVYCRSGNRSAVATARMVALGFTALYDVDGGILDWAAAGGEVVR